MRQNAPVPDATGATSKQPSSLSKTLGSALLCLSGFMSSADAQEIRLADAGPLPTASMPDPMADLALPARPTGADATPNLDPAPSIASRVAFDPTLPLAPDIRPERPRLFFGGGPLSTDALKLFAAWAGGENAKILVIGWGSEIPKEYATTFREKLLSVGGPEPIEMPSLRELNGDYGKALELAKDATGIFLLGGDQGRLIDALNQTGLTQHLRMRVEEDSVVFGGTSAGTAVGAAAAIIGTGMAPNSHLEFNVLPGYFVTEGLSLLAPEIMIEQHGLRPGRLDRLHGALSSTSDSRLGFCIEDGGCLVAAGDGYFYSVGPTKVHLFSKNLSGIVEQREPLQDGLLFEYRNPETKTR
jgi:cyanophycinase